MRRGVETMRASVRMSVTGLMAAVLASSSPARAVPGPWQRTETREPCANFNVLRSPYFGETHVHTAYSVDASIFDVRGTVRDAYNFATGHPIGLAPYDAQGNGTRTLQLRRPLDFTAVTDHSEGFGENYICLTPGEDGYDGPQCQQLRAALQAGIAGDHQSVLSTLNALLIGLVALPNPTRWPLCGPGGVHCLDRASLVWSDVQAAAEEFYDRSAACTFTTFKAYEWSGTPLGSNLHRNVIFRNDAVPALPVSYLEQQTPQGLWTALQAACDGVGRCDWLAIPHNSNASQGKMFLPENADGSALTAADAALRAASEPLVELFQVKGNSECKPGAGTADEECAFESINRTTLTGPRNPNQVFAPLSFVRNALKEGLVQEQTIGVNPFRLGFIGSTDNHNAIPGGVREDDYAGASGLLDSSPGGAFPPGGRLSIQGIGQVEHNPGGLAVAWAEENSRDAIFAAMRRREVYATSGIRPIVRFFAGDYAPTLCNDPKFVWTGYLKGVPMGAEVGPLRPRRSPTFAVLASKDPGEAGLPAVPLQRVQIVKGWVDASGTAQEKVFDVAGNANNGASVDLATCTPVGAGFDTLCTTWEDPEFDPSQRAFYYARVLENPTCRWSTYQCNTLGVDCSNPASVPADLQACCAPDIPKTHQERAWTSPIWYRPEGIGKLRATVHFGRAPGQDTFDLSALLGTGIAYRVPHQDFALTVRDDDTIFDATIPAGTLQQKANGKFILHDDSGQLGGVKRLLIRTTRSGGLSIRLRTIPMDLSHADRGEHMVEVMVRFGDFAVSQSRLWTARAHGLGTK